MQPWGASNASPSNGMPQWGAPGLQSGNFLGTFQPRPSMNWQPGTAPAIGMGPDPWQANGGRGIGGNRDPWRQQQPWEDYNPIYGGPSQRTGPWSDVQPGGNPMQQMPPPIPPPPTSSPVVQASVSGAEIITNVPPVKESDQNMGAVGVNAEPATEPATAQNANAASEDPIMMIARAI